LRELDTPSLDHGAAATLLEDPLRTACAEDLNGNKDCA
jgi:hypothetical protein